MLGAGLLFGALLRAVQIATSIGTVDASNWLRHVLYVHQLGVLRSYQASPLINHPPFGLELAYWSGRLGGMIGLQFFDALRIVTSAADLVTALALYFIARRAGGGVWVALVFFLSPAAIFISAFHCNTDPVMAMFVVLSLLAAMRQRPILSGLFIGLAVGTKIIAFAALPLLLFSFRTWAERLRFAGAAAAVGAIVFVPAFVVSGAVAVRNIFGYTGRAGAWGLTFVLPAGIVTPLMILALLALWIFAARRGALDGERLPRLAGLAFLLVLFLGPGFAMQYFHWILPYPALLLGRRGAVAVHALISAFLFLVYTIWADEWPWLWAGLTVHPPWVDWLGVAVWLAIGWTLARGLRHSSSSSSPPALLYFLVLL